MKIAVINGQNHKGSTYHIGRMLAEKLEAEENIKEIFLPKDMPHFCCGCFKCILEDEKLCPHYSCIKPITALIDDADVLIFTTPVYVLHATGSMKALLDHYGYRFIVHRPEERMFSKQAVCISTAAGSGVRSAIKDIKDSLFYWGVAKIYSFGIGVQATSWNDVTIKKKEKIEKKTSKLANMIRNKEGRVRPSIKTKLFFFMMRMVNQNPWNQVDGDYWRLKGWLGSERPWKMKKEKSR